MLISHKHKFIYIKAMKVAGTSVEVLLQKHCLPPKQASEYNYDAFSDGYSTDFGVISGRGRSCNSKWNSHTTPEQVINEFGFDLCNEYFKICNVRNPFEVVASMYNYSFQGKNTKVDIKDDFVRFIETSNVSLNKSMWCVSNKSFKYDFYVRFENLVPDLHILFKMLNLNEAEINNLPHLKRNGRKRPYREYYNQRSIKLVSDLYEDEIKAFNYSW